MVSIDLWKESPLGLLSLLFLVSGIVRRGGNSTSTYSYSCTSTAACTFSILTPPSYL